MRGTKVSYIAFVTVWAGVGGLGDRSITHTTLITFMTEIINPSDITKLTILTILTPYQPTLGGLKIDYGLVTHLPFSVNGGCLKTGYVKKGHMNL